MWDACTLVGHIIWKKSQGYLGHFPQGPLSSEKAPMEFASKVDRPCPSFAKEKGFLLTQQHEWIEDIVGGGSIGNVDNANIADADAAVATHEEELAHLLKKVEKIVNNLLARANSMLFREPGERARMDKW